MWADSNTVRRSLASSLRDGRVGMLLVLCAALTACGGGAATTANDATTPPSSTGNPSTSVVNAPPTISGSAPTSVVAGQPYSFAPSASDPEGAALTFSISGQPSWATFNSSTGKLTGTAAAGTFANISISVSDGKNTVALAAFSITVAPGATAMGSATVAWTPPTTNSDGSTLADLAGYRIYYGTNQNSLSTVVSITNPGLAIYTIDGLTAGTYFFSVTAVDASGTESSLSNIASKKIG